MRGLGAIRLMGAGLVVLSVLVHAAEPTSQAQAEKRPSVSPAVAKPLSEAHAALRAERWEEALRRLREAQAIDGRTAFENYQIDEMLGFAHVRTGAYAEAAAAFERGLKSGYLPEDRVQERLRALLQLNYEIKNYDKAVEIGQRLRAIQTEPDAEISAIVGRAQYLRGDYRAAAEAMEQAIEQAQSAGAPVQEAWLQVQLSSYAELQNADGILGALERLAVEFPKKKYWEDLFSVLKRQPDMDPRARMNLYRLMFDAGLMQEAEDYVRSGEIALRLGVPGEALAVLEQGQARKVFDNDRARELGEVTLEEARDAAQADRGTLATLEQEARASKNGEADVQLGIAYMSYGQYDKAAVAIQRGLQKGGLKHANEADLVLGRTLYKLDRKSEAITAFERAAAAARPGDELSQRLGTLAELWLVYLRQPAAVTT